MPNLVDIPTVVTTLITFFATGGTQAAIEAIKGITVNGALKLAKLKDDLLCDQEVTQAVDEYQQNPLDLNLKAQLEEVLTQALEQHPSFVQVQGDIKAEKGSIAVGVAKDSNFTINNTSKD